MNRLLASALLLATTALACSPDLDKTSEGDNGRLGFSLRSGSCLLFGCELDRPVLAGAKMDVRVSQLEPVVDYAVRSASPGVASVQKGQRTCTCSKGGELDRAEDACPEGETKSCELLVTVDSSAAGDARLEVVTSDGKVVDAASVHFVAADRIESSVQAGSKTLQPGADGVYQVPAGTSFGVESNAFAGGTQLEIGERGFRVDYTDPEVVGSDAPGLFDGATREAARAAAKGDGSIRIATLGGATREIRIRVVP